VGLRYVVSAKQSSTYEVEPSIEAEIREGQLEDAKLKEIRQLI
jgi:hypothetical protein